MTKKIFFLIPFLFIQNSQAQSSCPAKGADDFKKICQEVIPKCIDDIKDPEPADPKSKPLTPEEKVVKLTGDLSDEELMTRLVFGESMASHCMTSSEATSVTQGIAWVVTNRFRANKSQFGIGREVVTKAQQFRSTLGTYDVAQRKAFLCPSNSGTEWSKIWAQAKEAVKVGVANKSNPVPETYHYYLHEHFKGSKMEAKYYGKLPGWADKATQMNMPELSKDSKCLTLYKVK